MAKKAPKTGLTPPKTPFMRRSEPKAKVPKKPRQRKQPSEYELLKRSMKLGESNPYRFDNQRYQ